MQYYSTVFANFKFLISSKQSLITDLETIEQKKNIVFNAQRKTRSKKLAQKIRTKKSRLGKNIIILSPKQRK